MTFEFLRHLKKILKRLEKLLKLNYNKEKGDIECNRKI